MNDSKTPKIVVGVGLAAIYAVGLTVLTLRDKHEGAVAPADAPAAQVADAAPPPATIPPPVDAAPSVAEPAAAPAAVAPTPAAPVASAAAKTPSKEKTASVAAVTPRVKSEVAKPNPASQSTGAGNEPITPAADAPSTAQTETATPASDSQAPAEPTPQVAEARNGEALDQAIN